MAELTIDEKFGLILQSIGKIEKSVEGIEKSVDEMKTDISDIKKVQVNHSEILKKQNQIIELLSSRSLMQESDIKRIDRTVSSLIDLVAQDTEIDSINKENHN